MIGSLNEAGVFVQITPRGLNFGFTSFTYGFFGGRLAAH